MTRVIPKPADLGEAGWNAILPPRSPNASLQQEIECDYLIVGAGFAGLAAALRLRQLEPDADIVILEAREVAEGPTGRNSGFMIDLPHALASASYAGEYAEDLRQIRLNRSAIKFAAEASRGFGFPAEAFELGGKVNVAAGASGLRHNQQYARHLEQLGEAYEMLDAAAMQELCGSHYYRGGLHTPGTAILQPALYIRSFADALVNQSTCRLFENSPVSEYYRQGDGWQVKSNQGSVRASRLILAVNGLIETFGFYQRRLIHINLYASMTRALTDAEIDRLGGASRWGFTPADPLGSTLRRIETSGGTRLIIRNRCTYDASLQLPANRLAEIEPDHRRTFDARFPMLNAVDFEYSWSGRLCLSRNEVWALGELEPGLFSACCQNGLGATRGTIAGIVAAELASDSNAESLLADFREGAEPKKLFPEPLMTMGARSVIRFKELRAGREL